MTLLNTPPRELEKASLSRCGFAKRWGKLETRWRMARRKRLFTWRLLPFSTGSRPRVFGASPRLKAAHR